MIHEWVSEKIGSETNARLATNFNTTIDSITVCHFHFPFHICCSPHNVGTYLTHA